MFQNEISDKLQFFAEQGMDREMVINDNLKKRITGRSIIKRGHMHKKSHQLKLF